MQGTSLVYLRKEPVEDSLLQDFCIHLFIEDHDKNPQKNSSQKTMRFRSEYEGFS